MSDSSLPAYRSELKYAIHHSQRDLLLNHWARFLIKAPFTNENAVSPILSQYYDSPDFIFVTEKAEGLRLRNKVRIRVYGQRFSAGQLAVLEIKRRRSDFVRKDRFRISNFDPNTHLVPKNWEFDDKKMRSAFLGIRDLHKLRPSAQTYYQREAYQSLAESDVRVTLDSNLIGLYPGETLNSEIMRDRSRALMPDTIQILELKSTNGFPAWIYDGIARAGLRQQPIPKYTTAVKVLKMNDMHPKGNYL